MECSRYAPMIKFRTKLYRKLIIGADSNIINKGAEYVPEKYPLESAGYFWKYIGKINSGNNDTDTNAITNIINPGAKDLDKAERRKYYSQAKKYII